MTQNLTLTAHTDERTSARSDKARAYARWMKVALMCLCLTAIWQEKRLAPPVHDGMQSLAGMAMNYVENSETLSEALKTAQKSYEEMISGG